MSSEAYLGWSGAGCGQRAVLKPGLPAAVAGLPAASAAFSGWNAGTASRRHAE